jgi:hypothetical protein
VSATGSYPEPAESTLHPAAIFPKINFHPILLSTPWSFEWSLSFGLSHQNLVHFSVHSQAFHTPRPPHSASFDLPNDIWGWVQIMKLLTVQLPTFSCYFIPLRSKYSPWNSVLKHSVYSFFNVRYQVSHPYKTTDRIMGLYILIFTFLDSRREDKLQSALSQKAVFFILPPWEH